MSNEKPKEQATDTGHDYDGIRELDNQLPTWWLWSFYLTVIFSVPYVAYYHAFNGPTLNQEYAREQEAIAFQQASKPAQGALYTESSLLEATKDSNRLAQGKQAFSIKCVSCHGAHGQGGIGPNLTDEYWLHGRTLVEIAKTVDQGVLDKGMPGWRAMMSSDELISIVAFVNSLQGTNPAGAKAPQGVKN